jgi:hypothetical protein
MGRDAQALAFDALLPLAKPTAAALERVDKTVRAEREIMESLRAGFTPTLHAGVLGLDRFDYAVIELGNSWLVVPKVKRASSPKQEANNIYLWTLGNDYVLRVKRDPVDGVAEGTQRLFEELPVAGVPSVVFLTWDIDLAYQISAPRFVCLEEPKWTISLRQLLAHGVEPGTGVLPAITRRPVVRSKTKRRDERSRDLQDRQRNDS